MEYKRIHRLSNEIIGKIAAGEVVENPASAIKELIENSLDAGASCITVEIRDGGITYLRVTDNGRGIPFQDVRMAFERHATSKIQNDSDLFNLDTLGFRGEALASIAAVSKITLTTHFIHEDIGVRVINEGGEIKDILEAACAQGTTIVARELFYNTPVRLKFLKKPVTESAKVAEVVSRFILAHPDKSFKLINNGRQVYHSPGNGDLRSSVFCVYGRDAAQGMTSVRYDSSVSVSGLLGVGDLARSNRDRQVFILNGRTIRSSTLSKGVEDGCKERVTVGHLPTCVLKIDIPSDMVDVNVHPNKMQVRFSNEQVIYQHIYEAVKSCFHQSVFLETGSLFSDEPKERFATETVKVIDPMEKKSVSEPSAGESIALDCMPIGNEKTETIIAEKKNGQTRSQSDVPPTADRVNRIGRAAMDADNQESPTKSFSDMVVEYFGNAALRESSINSDETVFSIKEQPIEYDTSNNKNKEMPIEKGHTEHAQQDTFLPNASENVQGSKKNDRSYTILGTAFGTYIIVQEADRLFFIDQHAAHERIVFEQMMKKLDQGIGSQVLMVSKIVHVSPKEKQKIEMYRSEIEAAGYVFESFGEDAYTIHAVPNILGEPETAHAFLDLVDHLGELQVLATHQKRRDAILQLACKKAVKGGEYLDDTEIRALIDSMDKLSSPPTCPHGRPIIISITKTDLEKRFKRINN